MEIWIGRDGERHGPYKEDDVRQWLRSGQVSPADLAWHEGLADWQPLSVLFPDVAVAPPPATANPYAAPAAPLLPQTTAAALEDHAGFWKRVAAYILDAIVLYIPQVLIEKAFGGDAAKAALKQASLDAVGNPDAMMAANMHYYSTMWPAMLLIVVLGVLYFTVCESSAWQGTLGKLALGIRVTDLEGRRISFPRALGRYFAKILSAIILGVGFLMVAWTQRKQGLHDMICGTLVLNGRASEFKASPSTADSRNSFSA
ncbi:MULTISPECIES: RDD family protein [Rhodanobacter]|uniref:Putative membrane protein/domain protein n=1 Tax=Rhodanobacter denitrificans TaxID=666685 RepID=M4NM56_9GAMM|nr:MULTISPECIES: RDD family protein [Rhodanobacter]AGG90743.1 putative membrane protein/domain protein [Rhodanobacter denitrificans]KZC18553.1 transporter [Rhodanobacter denitrificans]UJJ50824.1 RDD family protein [Rhodanobacter denitrificans]UJJ56976.1 RDD family protein [Rhodanobacter denitrificans]UJM86121.1 RDD family protein [Rhodanobacter denitrificans]